MVTRASLSFSEKAFRPIDFMCAGSAMLVIWQPLKQFSVISVTVSGMLIFRTQVLFSNPPRTFTLGFSVTVAPDLWHETSVSYPALYTIRPSIT